MGPSGSPAETEQKLNDAHTQLIPDSIGTPPRGYVCGYVRNRYLAIFRFIRGLSARIGVRPRAPHTPPY